MGILSSRLKYAREKNDLKQTDVQKVTGINNKTLSNYENGVSSPNPETLKILAILYNVSADYLLGIDIKTENRTITENQSELLKKNDELDPQYQIELKKYAELLKIKQSIDKSNPEVSEALTEHVLSDI